MRAILATLIAALPLVASGAARQKIAVLDLRAVQGVSPGTATILTAIVVDEASRGAGFDVISQADVSAMLGFEKQKQMLGCSEDSSCLAEIGGALGADFVLSGQVGQIGSRYHLALQLLDARRAKVASRVARFADRDEDALASTAQATTADLLGAARGAPRVAAPASKEPAVAQRAPAPDLSARPAPPPPTVNVERASARPRRRLAWAAVGGGAALLTGGVVFGLAAKNKRTELEQAWRDPAYPNLYQQKESEAKKAVLLSTVCTAAGLVSTGVGVWLFVRSPAPVAVAPVLGEGQVGLVAMGHF